MHSQPAVGADSVVIMGPDLRERIERWFVHQGVPHFIAGYSAARDIWTRTTPILVAYLLVGLVSAANFDWSVLQNALAVVGGAVIVGGGFALLNIRRRRPWNARPTSIGWLELGAIVVLPAVPPAIIGGQVQAVAFTILTGLVFLALVYVTTSYGLLPITSWALRRLASQVGDVIGLAARAMPLLVIFVGFAFFQNEVWQLNAALDAGPLGLVVGLFFASGTLFILARLPREIRELSADRTWPNTIATAARTPAAPLARVLGGDEPRAVPLTGRQWGNVGLVVLVSQGIQILFVTLAVILFLVLLGVLSIPLQLQQTWAGAPVTLLVDVSFAGHPLPLTDELLKVAIFLGAFCGFYFTVYALTDGTYRAEFFEEVIGELRVSLAVRSVYLAAIDEDAREKAAEAGSGGAESTAPV